MTSSRYGTNDTVKNKKKEPGRRSWRDEEEKVLLACLKDAVADRWKSDNGFRAGYANRLADAMNKHFPKANIKGDPHINSKITAWKKNYGSLVTILKRSGVGFNLKGDHAIDCDDETREDICWTDPHAKKSHMRERSWPLFEEWKEVFGKDRATGTRAKDVMESVNELFAEHHYSKANGHQPKDKIIDLDDNLPVPDVADSICQSQRGDSTAKPKKKRKAQDSLDNLCKLLKEIHKDTNQTLQDLAVRLGYQHDMGKAKKEVYPLLKKISNFSIDDKLCACSIILAKNECVEMFMSLPEEDRPAYLSRLLKHGEYNWHFVS